MASLRIDTGKIRGNIAKLNDYLSSKGMGWTLVSKVLCGHRETLEKVLSGEESEGLHSVGESRIGSLRLIKELRPDLSTMYIKPPEMAYARQVVRYADFSLNTSLSTIKSLNKEARDLGKVHNIVIMIELGELREGILRGDVERFYEDAFHLSNVNVAGIGTNLGCMYGIEPTKDKLVQLCLYKKLLEARFGERLDLVSGGSSITLPLIEDGKVPVEVNHLRIGESAFFGTSPLDNKRFLDLALDAFEFSSQIIELKEKELIPDGTIGDASIGHTGNGNSENGLTNKAILDFGMLDAEYEDLAPKGVDMDFVGISSDMCVYDIYENDRKLGTGDKIAFKPRYLATAKLMLSKFIAKNVV